MPEVFVNRARPRMAEIRARCQLVKTPFELDKGKSYRFSASGMWTDFFIKTSASGYSAWYLKCFERWRKVPEAKWFSLIGQIDEGKDTQFDIGKLLEEDALYIATATGVLHCFANDLRFMYWNNRGAIDLRVEEL